MRLTEERVVATIFFAAVVLAVIQALSFNSIARIVPLVVGVPLLLISLALFIRSWRQPAAGEGKKEPTGKKKETRTPLRELRVWAWVPGLILLIYLFGFVIGMAAFMLLFLRLESHESWQMSVGLTLVAGASIYAIFVWFLQMRLFQGILPSLIA